MIDPTDNLKEQLRLASKLIYTFENEDAFDAGARRAAANLGELVIQLDKHMAEGGDPPSAWRRPPNVLPTTIAFEATEVEAVRKFFDALRAGRGPRAEPLTAETQARLAALGFFG